MKKIDRNPAYRMQSGMYVDESVLSPMESIKAFGLWFPLIYPLHLLAAFMIKWSKRTGVEVS